MSELDLAQEFDLRRLLNPSSVAIAGASPDPNSIGGAVLRNVEASGFAGELTLVSPRRDEINGRPTIPFAGVGGHRPEAGKAAPAIRLSRRAL